MALRHHLALLVAAALAGPGGVACSNADFAQPAAEPPGAPLIASPKPQLQVDAAALDSAAEPDFPLLDPNRVESPVSAAAGVFIGELAYSYSTVDEISRAADGILIGSVMSVEYQSYQGLPFAVAAVNVLKSLKGSFQAGDVVTVVEMGGIHAGRSKLVPGAFGEPREVGVAGAAVMREGEQWLLFLSGPYEDSGPWSGGAYSVSGVFQGRLRLGRDGHLQFTGAPESLTQDELFAVPAALAGKRIDEAIRRVQEAIR